MFLYVLFFFTREIGDAQVLVPKPERLWVLQIKQGVLVYSPWGLWGSTSPLVPPQPLPTCTLAFSSLTSPTSLCVLQSACLSSAPPLTQRAYLQRVPTSLTQGQGFEPYSVSKSPKELVRATPQKSEPRNPHFNKLPKRPQ